MNGPKYSINDCLLSKNSNGKDIGGIVADIEWSTTYHTYCYKIDGYWVYQNDPNLRRQGEQPRPIIPPDPDLVSV